MTDHLISSLVTVATAIVGVAIVAVLVSRNADTSNVIRSAGSAFADDLRAATGPVSGGFGGFSGGGYNLPSLY